MTYQEFINKYNYRVLFDECDDSGNIFNLVFTNDKNIFTCYEINNLRCFCFNNSLLFDIGIFYGYIVCHIYRVVKDEILK